MTPVIMDGEVLPENLRSVGKDEVWLTRKLREQGYSAFGGGLPCPSVTEAARPRSFIRSRRKKTPREDGK